MADKVQEKQRREALATLTHGLSTYSAVIAGKAYDAGYKNGHYDGMKGAYIEGFVDANEYGSKAVIACTCVALRDLYGFGQKRMQAVHDAIRHKLLTEIDISETIKRCQEEFGLVLEDEVTAPIEEE
jgi:hypothetical protein